MRDIARDLRVGTCCGKCVPEAKATLAACLELKAQSGAQTVFFPSATVEFAV